jgi:hypothetical protein
MMSPLLWAFKILQSVDDEYCAHLSLSTDEMSFTDTEQSFMKYDIGEFYKFEYCLNQANLLDTLFYWVCNKEETCIYYHNASCVFKPVSLSNPHGSDMKRWGYIPQILLHPFPPPLNQCYSAELIILVPQFSIRFFSKGLFMIGIIFFTPLRDSEKF